MRRLATEIEEIHQGNRRTAEYGCAVMDEVRRSGLTPAILRDAQDGLRRDLLGTENQLREARRHAMGEKHRLSTSAKSDSTSREAALKHTQLLDARERALVMRRRMLRQIADGFAWLVLDQDPRLIIPLFEEQTHQLPPREGVGGPAEIARKAHDSGHFFVIENDLTRCLGTGDLTVVFADRHWRQPLAIEVKSSARPAWREGGQLELLAIAASTTWRSEGSRTSRSGQWTTAHRPKSLRTSSRNSATYPTASQLAFSVQPRNAFVAGAPTVLIAVQDASGNTVQSATTSITVAIGTNRSGGTLSGTTTVSAVNGVATFGDLSIDKAGTGYRFIASAAGLTGATSNAFDVVAFASVSVGGEGTCALTVGGAAYCWGQDGAGELGNGAPSDFSAHPTPTAVSGGLIFTALSAADRFACGITAAAAAYCWGFNGQGNLGAGTSTGPQTCVDQDLRTGQPASCSTVPVAVKGGLTFSAISAGGLGAGVHPGDSFVCGVSSRGTGYCWGGNGSGQLGDGTFTDRLIPVAVAGGLTFTTISGGRDHTCSVTASRAAYCWGGTARRSSAMGHGRTAACRCWCRGVSPFAL